MLMQAAGGRAGRFAAALALLALLALAAGGALLHYDGLTLRYDGAGWNGMGGAILYYYDSPDTPVNISPADNATTDDLTPVLQASPYAAADGDAHAASRWQVRSEGGGYGSPVWDSGSRAAATAMAVPAGKLAGSTRYYWRVAYQQAGGRWSGYSAETSFTTLAVAKVPPEVSGVAVEGIGSTSATLRLSLTTLGSAASVEVSFQWGLTAACDNSTAPQAMTGTGSYSVTLYELSAATTYHFRAVAAGDGTWRGPDAVFTTGGKPPQAPEVASFEAAGVGAGWATLRGELRGLGSAAGVEVCFEWGRTADYGAATTPRMMNAPGPFSFEITGLAPGATYHFRARAMGDGEAGGSDLAFDTPGAAGVAVATGEAADVTASTALLQGDLTSLGGAGIATASFEWGTVRGGPYPYETAAGAREAPGGFESPLTGLVPGATYYYRAKAAAGGAAAYGDEGSFTTVPAAPVIRGLEAGSGSPGDQLEVTIRGACLGGATAVGFGPGIAVTEFAAVSSGELTARITIGRGAEAGEREVSVTTPGGTASAPGLFAVDAGRPAVHLRVYLAAGAGGIAALGLLALLVAWLWRRPARRATGAS